MWIRGQKVICVNDRFNGGVIEWGDQLPRCGFTYTIRSVHWCPDGVTEIPGVCFLLEELKNPDDLLKFSEWHFRPVVEELVGTAACVIDSECELVY